MLEKSQRIAGKRLTTRLAVSTDVLMYASIGYLEAPGMDMSSEGLPWLSCEGTNFMSLQWDQQLLKYDPSDVTTPIKGVKVDNQPIYIDDVYTQGDGMGIWFLPEKNYYAPLKSSFYPTTICGTNSEGLNIIAVSFTGNDESTKTLFDKTLDIAAVQPGMVMCPDTSSASVSTLADVKWSDPADKSQISDVIAMASSTLFHEFTHLTTFWGKVTDPNSDKFGDFYLRGSSTVLDYACQILPFLPFILSH